MAALLLWVLGSSCGDNQAPGPLGRVSVGPIPIEAGHGPGEPPRTLGVVDARRFSGVAVLGVVNGGGTAALVVASVDDVATDGPAYLLTAGHSVLGGAGANPFAIVQDADLTQIGQYVQFRWYQDAPDDIVNATLFRISFATMKGTDLAVVELAESREALRRQGVLPFVLSTRQADVDETLVVVGHPNLGFAQMTACALRARVPLLVEESFHWFSASSHLCSGIYPGSSGSPVFSAATGEVVGVVNTLAETDNSPPCALSHPCEGSEDPARYVAGASYSMDVAGLGACFDGQGRFAPDRPTCSLDRGVQMEPLVPEVRFAASPGIDHVVDIGLEPHGLTHYRWKVGPMPSTDCRDGAGYGDVSAWASAPTIHASVTGNVGISFLCVQAGPGPDPTAAAWQPLATPTVLVITASDGG